MVKSITYLALTFLYKIRLQNTYCAKSVACNQACVLLRCIFRQVPSLQYPERHQRIMASECPQGNESKKQNSCTAPHPSFEILNIYPKKHRQGEILRPASETTLHRQDLTPETIVGMAKMRSIDDRNLSSSGLSPVNIKDISLAQSLLTAAEMVSNQQFDSAKNLLRKCIIFSSRASNPVERVVRLFAEALTERIDIERGKFDLERYPFDLEGSLLKYEAALIITGQKIPSPQVIKFAGVETILDRVRTAKKIHFLVFGISHGFFVSIMIQGLANRKNSWVELLKVSNVGTSKAILQETGKRLTTFAESMNLPFLFKSVILETELMKDPFEVEPDEALVVYFGLHLYSLLSWPNHLKPFLQVIKKLNPCLIVLNEFEASTNTLPFIDRFQEAFVLMLATFDCLDACLKGDSMSRMVVEGVFLREMIRNMIIAEDEERKDRHEKIGFWRDLFAELGIVETQLSRSSLYQASLLIKGNPDWKDSCTLKMDGDGLIVRWKGTPLQSISAWKIDGQRIDT